MSADLDTNGRQPNTLEEKVDALSTSVDRRFDGVAAALVEQREYTEFAFDGLKSEMQAGFAAVETRFGGIDGQLVGIDGRFDRIDGRFDRIDGRFDRVDGRLNRIERKLDQFIDTQSKTNALVERRLNTLEPEPGPDAR